ncbi:MAG: hypothetical protein AAF789_13190 [Bacteroidota bacterium]
MSQSFDLKIFGLVLIAFTSCQKLKPTAVNIPEYPDLKELMITQADILAGKSVEKTVFLEENDETKRMMLDSAKWIKELNFLEEINPNQPEYVGALTRSENEEETILTLSEGENGALKRLSFSKNEDQFKYLEASFHEDKDVYIHHREISLTFADGLLSSYRIDGYQKMMFKDTVRFKIVGKIN